MRKTLVGTLLIVALLIPGAAPATESTTKAPEACLAVNPGMPTCTLKITSDSGSTPTGWEGVGNWEVEVKRGKKIFRYKSNDSAVPGPIPVWGHSFVFKVGDVVKATATTPGSSILAGHTT